MRCNRVDDLLPAYHDGDLSSRLCEQVSAHLDGCERCRQAQVEQQRALRFLEGGRYVPSIDLWAEFSRRLEQEQRPRPSPWRFLWQPGLAGALAAAVVSVVVFSAPDRRPAARWLPAPPGSVQIARAPQTPLASVAPRTQSFRSRASRPSPPAPTPAVAQKRPRPTAVSSTAADRSTRSAGERPQRRPRRQSGRVVLAKHSASSELRRSPRVRGTDRVEERRSWQIAALPPAPAVIETPGLHGLPGAEPGAGSAGPLAVAEALMSVQQDAASDQMQNELLLMARQVARVSGELPTVPIWGDGSGT